MPDFGEELLAYSWMTPVALTRFVGDGALEIDNNLIENAIRPSALGKKNWMFIGHPEAGERSAVIWHIARQRRRRYGLNPFDYLKG